ncbi:MAG TPA: hypothetical protein PK671_19870, partial [Candidatus Obscuribacter sp.]|nr:hypothetical protein [Candidatus Obscuribacter sp.]
ASPGNLASDYEKLVAAMLDRPPTKQPKLILLTYSYRDFFDNLAQSDENASPVAKMLTYTRERGHFLPDCRKLFSGAALEETATCLLHHKRHLHSVAALFRTTLAKQAEQLRKTYLVQTPKQNTRSETAIPKLDRQTDMKVYKTRYQPLNEIRWHSQLQALERLLYNCRQRNIPVAMVNMPVTDANLSLLPSEMKGKWQAPIRTLAKKHGAALKDFDEADAAGVTDTDFADSVHLNQDGARKFADRLFRWLGSTKQYQKAFEQS